MLRKLEYKTSNSHGGQLLRDIEEISKALYLDKTPPPTKSNARSKSAGKLRLSESKSVWSWKKPLRALSHIGDKKFHCRFYLHVHSIEGLHSNFDHLSLCVHWKRKNEAVSTSSAKVSQGIAEFEETLVNQCSVYGSSGGPDHPVKYESKLFLLYPSVVEAPSLDLGKQWFDPTSFLPRTLEELEGDKSRGQWTTSFNLSGKAKGACLNISFGFWVTRDKLPESSGYAKFPELLNTMQNKSSADGGFGSDHSNFNRMIGRVGSVPNTVNVGADLLRQSLDVKVCREVLLRTGLELSNSINSLYQKLDEGNLDVSDKPGSQQLDKHKPKIDLDFVSAEDIESYDWDITEVGTEISVNEDMTSESDQASSEYSVAGLAIEAVNVDVISRDDSNHHYFDGKIEDLMADHKAGLATEEMDSASNIQAFESTDLREFVEQEKFKDVIPKYEFNRSVKRSLSLDDVAESVASDFFNMLGLDGGSPAAGSCCDPESPRELLLRQFEKEALASGNFIFDFDAKNEESPTGCGIATGFSLMDDIEESELSLIIHDAEQENKRPSELLKRRKANILEDLETEDLMREWGLNEKDFQNSPGCSGGFGSPIELSPKKIPPLPPLEEGFGPYVQMKNGGFLSSMSPSLFRNSKNGGNLIIQLSNPAVLPEKMGHDAMDIMQNLVLVGVENLYEQIHRLVPIEDITGKTIKQVASPSLTTTSQRKVILQYDSGGGSSDNNLESDPLMNGLPLEFTSLEDLSPLIGNKIEGLLLEGLKTQSRMPDEQPPCSIFPRFSGETAATVSDLVGLSLTLDEWMRRDARNSGDETQLLGGKCGLLGNNLTVFYLAQLRNPLRNYEPVGVPVLLLAQVQRSVYKEETLKDNEVKTRYYITGVHIAGVNTFPLESQLWGTAAQQQSGTRWLVSNGLASRNVGGYASNSKAIVRTSPLGVAARARPGDVLWSISTEVGDSGTTWKDLLMSHTRNPDVIFPSGPVKPTY